MEALGIKLAEVVLGYGLPGVIILYLIYERKGLQDQIKELMLSLNASQEARIKEARETTKAIGTIEDTLDILKDFIKSN